MRRLPPLRLLTTFDAVARLGSMREAASALNVSQPAITQALQDLEAHIGVRLFDRSKRPARLTEDGQQLASAVRDGLAQIAIAIDAIAARAATREKQVTVACTLGMATYWLMPRLVDFYNRHPDITVNVQAPPGDLPALVPGIDIALRYGSGDFDDGGRSRLLFAERVFPVGKASLVRKLLEGGGDLLSAPLIHVSSPENLHWAGWQQYLAHRNLSYRNPRGPTFNNYVQATQAALDGQGLMLGWRSVTGKLVSDGHLAAWPDGELDLGTGYYVIEGENGPAACTAFVDWLFDARDDQDPAAG